MRASWSPRLPQSPHPEEAGIGRCEATFVASNGFGGCLEGRGIHWPLFREALEIDHDSQSNLFDQTSLATPDRQILDRLRREGVFAGTLTAERRIDLRQQL